MQPIGIPSRNLKAAFAFFDGNDWLRPLIAASSRAACSTFLESELLHPLPYLHNLLELAPAWINVTKFLNRAGRTAVR